MADVKKKWRGLRNTFVANYKAERMQKSGSAAKAPIKWEFYNVMKFLIPYIQINKTISNYTNTESVDLCTDNAVSNIEAIDDISGIEYSIPSASSTSSEYSHTKKKTKTNPNERVAECLEKIIDEFNTPEKSSIHKFAESLADEACLLTKAQQMQLRKEWLENLTRISEI